MLLKDFRGSGSGYLKSCWVHPINSKEDRSQNRLPAAFPPTIAQTKGETSSPSMFLPFLSRYQYPRLAALVLDGLDVNLARAIDSKLMDQVAQILASSFVPHMP